MQSDSSRISSEAAMKKAKYEWAVSSQEYTYKKQTEHAVADAIAEAEPKAKAASMPFIPSSSKTTA